MKKNNITTSIGTINLNDISFVEDTLDVFIGIDSVSAEIQHKINESVEIAKAEYIQMVKNCFKHKNLNWSDAGVNIDLSLHIIIEKKEFSYQIEVDITDRKDKRIWTDASIKIDLSEHQEELKKFIIKAMIDKIF